MTDEEPNETPVSRRGDDAEPTRESTLLTVEQYASVLAHLAHFQAPDHAEMLARLDVDPALWDASHDAWSERLEACLDQEDYELATEFGRAFAATKNQLAEQQPALESIGELSSEQETPPSEVPKDEHATVEQQRTQPEPAPERGAAAPAEPTAPVAPSPMPIRARSSGSSARPSPWAAGRPESPGAAAAPLPRAPAEPPPPADEQPAESPVDETVLGVPVVDADPLPFDDTPDPEFQERLRRDRGRARPVHDQVGETQEVSALLEEGPALPFEPAASRTRSDAAEPAPSTDSVDETMAVSAVLDREPALPFADKPAAPREEPREPPPEPDLAGETQEASAVLDRGPALPLPKQDTEQADSDPSTHLDFHQYASIRAELAVCPDREAHIFARYGVADAPAFAALDAAWSKRLAAHPEDRKKLDELVLRFCAWLEKQQEGSKS